MAFRKHKDLTGASATEAQYTGCYAAQYVFFSIVVTIGDNGSL